MMQHVTEYNQRLSQCQDKESQGGRRIVVSVEVEKMRPQLVELLPLADVVGGLPDDRASRSNHSYLLTPEPPSLDLAGKIITH